MVRALTSAPAALQQLIALQGIILGAVSPARGIVDVAIARRGHQRRDALELAQVRQRTVLQQQLHRRHVARLGRAQQRRGAPHHHRIAIAVVGDIAVASGAA